MGGYAVLKRHSFFDGIVWDSLHTQQPPELLPFLPANSDDSENLWSQYKVMIKLIPRADNLGSGFHLFGIGKMNNSKDVCSWVIATEHCGVNIARP
jgi:hypothetical protein